MCRSVDFSTHHISSGHAFSISVTNSTLPCLTALIMASITLPFSSCWTFKPCNTSHMRSKSFLDWWWRSFNSYILSISESIIKTMFSQLNERERKKMKKKEVDHNDQWVTMYHTQEFKVIPNRSLSCKVEKEKKNKILYTY